MPPPEAAGRPPVATDILIEAGAWPAQAKLARLVNEAVGACVVATRVSLGRNAELSVVFTDDANVRALNRSYRGKDRATNVLSFPASRVAGSRGVMLGDVVLAAETVAAEAKASGLALEAHLTHLIVHGFLHLLGYDHDEDKDAATMERLETVILSSLGIADPYEGRDVVRRPLKR